MQAFTQQIDNTVPASWHPSNNRYSANSKPESFDNGPTMSINQLSPERCRSSPRLVASPKAYNLLGSSSQRMKSARSVGKSASAGPSATPMSCQEVTDIRPIDYGSSGMYPIVSNLAKQNDVSFNESADFIALAPKQAILNPETTS